MEVPKEWKGTPEGNTGRMERSSRSVRTHSESNTGSGKTDCKQFFRVL